MTSGAKPRADYSKSVIQSSKCGSLPCMTAGALSADTHICGPRQSRSGNHRACSIGQAAPIHQLSRLPEYKLNNSRDLPLWNLCIRSESSHAAISPLSHISKSANNERNASSSSRSQANLVRHEVRVFASWTGDQPLQQLPQHTDPQSMSLPPFGSSRMHGGASKVAGNSRDIGAEEQC